MLSSIHPLRKHVLVVEDSPIIRKLIEVCLRPMNLDLTLVANGVEGLEAASHRPPDAVLLDIAMPGMNGWDVLEGLRTGEATKTVPVLVLTGHGETYSESDAERRGADGLMTKPFLPTALRTAMRGLLSP